MPDSHSPTSKQFFVSMAALIVTIVISTIAGHAAMGKDAEIRGASMARLEIALLAIEHNTQLIHAYTTTHAREHEAIGRELGEMDGWWEERRRNDRAHDRRGGGG